MRDTSKIMAIAPFHWWLAINSSEWNKVWWMGGGMDRWMENGVEVCGERQGSSEALYSPSGFLINLTAWH